MEVIQFATLDEQRSVLMYYLVFMTALGAILGGIWEQSASGLSSFWPHSYKRIVGLSALAALLGLGWGYSGLDRVYQFECRADDVALWKANSQTPKVLRKVDIAKVVPGLRSVRGSRIWEIHFYDKNGHVHSSSTIDDRTMKKYLNEIHKCLSAT